MKILNKISVCFGGARGRAAAAWLVLSSLPLLLSSRPAKAAPCNRLRPPPSPAPVAATCTASELTTIDWRSFWWTYAWSHLIFQKAAALPLGVLTSSQSTLPLACLPRDHSRHGSRCRFIVPCITPTLSTITKIHATSVTALPALMIFDDAFVCKSV